MIKERRIATIGLKEALESEQKRLTGIKKTVEERLRDVPEGALRIAKCGGSVQYYLRKPGGPHSGIYLPRSKAGLAGRLAQKTYDKKVQKLCETRLCQLNRILKDYEDNEIEMLYLKEQPQRRKLITPVEPTYLQKVEEWRAKPYTGKNFPENAPVILTNKGLRVRSKSEKIMADYFDSMNIVYKYECPVYLPSYGDIYPDFTFLSPGTKQEIYWEHEGMMDNPDYARSAVKKIELYEKNGIYPGERLILTFETAASAINTNLLKKLTDKYLI